MVKKIILLFTVVFYAALVKNTAFAQDQHLKDIYQNNIQKNIEKNWIPPLKADDKSTVVSFVINKNGSVSNIKVIRSSNDTQFDKRAIEAISKVSSFQPLTGNENLLSVKFFFSPAYTSLTVDDSTNNTTNQIFGNNGSKIIPVSNRNYTDFTDYAANLQNKINSNWNPRIQKKQRDAVISIKVDKDGTLEDVKVQKSSGKKNFDQEILDSVMKSVPLDTLPDDLQVEYKNIQLNFIYEKTKDKKTPLKYVVANINNQDGYDEYVEQVEEIISKKLKDKQYFHKKDILLEMNINQDGKLKYVKIKNSSSDDEFNRKTLLTLQKTSFPPIPDKMNVSDITLNYRILTQRKRLFINFLCDYVWNFFRTGLESFCVQTSENI